MFQNYFQLKSSTKTKQLRFKIIDYNFSYTLRCNKSLYICYGTINFVPRLIKEYEIRQQDVVKNLFLFNKCVLENNKWLDMKTLLKKQHYHIDAMWKNTNFNHKYYNNLVKYTNKMMLLT